MIAIVSYYVLFAVMSGSVQALTMESVVMAGFLLIAILGFKLNLWLVVGALCAHGVFDFIHDYFISNPGVPAWWPMFCLTYDIAAAGYLAWLLSFQTLRPKRMNNMNNYIRDDDASDPFSSRLVYVGLARPAM